MAGSILLADDEEKILNTLGRALRDDGHEVITASNAKDAARLLSERSVDLLVIDFLMPDRTGSTSSVISRRPRPSRNGRPS